MEVLTKTLQRLLLGLITEVKISGGIKKGGEVIQYEHHGASNQQFQLCHDGTIKVKDTNLVLDIQGGQTSQGGNIIVWPHHGGANQKWRICNSFTREF